MARVVLAHPDGRCISADEADLTDETKNPFNHARPIVRAETREVRLDPGRPTDDHVCLLHEGFVIVADIAEADVLDAEGRVLIPKGGEIPRVAPEHYGSVTLHQHPDFDQNEHGARMSSEHRERRQQLGAQNAHDVQRRGGGQD